MLQHLDTAKKPFVGEEIVGVVRLGRDRIQFEFESGNVMTASVDGDCCSTSIFYDITLPSDYKGAVIEDIVEYDREGAESEETVARKLVENGFDMYQECWSIWNVVIKTNRGDIVLRHLNDSNGYYDGCLYLSDK